MTKQISGIVLSCGLLVLAGCMQEPMRARTDMSLPLTNSGPINLNGAIARAKAEHRIVLLDFTGSDWCRPCMALHKEVFSQPEFQSYAESNLIFLVVDFPAKYRLSPEANATNDSLSAKFDIGGFPTLIALNGDGKQIWRRLGFMEGSPKELLATLEAAKAKSR